jgi:pimeloyl-ACP methyl ester carboxylesterase
VAAAGDFGRTARIPTLWIYAQNDVYFAPALSKRLGEAFRDAGGNVEYHLLPPVGENGHLLINSVPAAALWGPIIANFLDERDQP